ncbi:MAG TPA: UvrD-helicase domain-containing protein, partial [Deinococcales bacterium]|nr:UvrD-helicase domain-containing protein [Deinococcales bacterium]
MTALNPEDLLTGLNDAQSAAARHYKGPALVVAGAGSGKTRTVVHRIAYLIAKHGVFPNEILAVTFTNKAAEEMRSRVARLLGPAGQEIWVSTFHSAGVRILRMYGERVGLGKNFVIYDDGDQLDLLKDALGALHAGPDANPRYLRAAVDRAKSNLWSPDDLAHFGEEVVAGLPRDIAVEGYRRYETLLKRANAVDFNDLLVKSVQLFQQNPDVLARVQKRAAFTHVDEYQDTNHAQYEMARLLASGLENLLVVGDPDQSIYRFRGADIRNILDFQKDYPKAVVYRLEENYRSNARILELANKLISANTERLEKTLVAVKPAGDKVKFHRAPDHREEAAFVAMRVEALAGEGAPYRDMAILYRTNAQSRVLEERFLRQGLPYRVVGGTSFYERQEIKDVLAYARLAINPSDDVALARALKRPRRGLGDSSIEKLGAFARAQGIPLLGGFARAREVLDRGADKAEDFAKLMAELGDYAAEHRAEEFLRLTLDVSGYQDMLKAERS